ncbi:MAG: sulfite exporter TauE/SafE family protein [Verrucomicrobia bacterium]|nr:sulfite exporter TauE/SafE family protein [Verrucomicrobiota bacterium]
MILFARLPMAVATGTSLAVIAVNSLAGWVGHLGREPIAWGMTGGYLLAALVGMTAGLRLSGRWGPALLRRVFGWLLLIMAGIVLMNNWTAIAALLFKRS